MPVLSSIKCVLKEYAAKRIGHNEEDFKQYIVPLIGKALQLSQTLQALISQVLSNSN